MKITVESVIGNIRNVFGMHHNETNKIRYRIIKEAFKFHYTNNTLYREYCEARKFSPKNLVKYEDVYNIPLIPIKMFKSSEANKLLSVSLKDIQYEVRSTGTSGIPSVSRRDFISMSRGAFGIMAMYIEFYRTMEGAGLYLSPSPAELPEMGLVKVLSSMTSVFNDHRYLVKNFNFKSQEALDCLNNWKGKFVRHIIGPPFLVSKLLGYMSKYDIIMPLDKNSFIAMLGGWKRYSGDQITRDAFSQLAAKHFNIKETNIRDMYGTIETNMLAVECRYNHMHIPPWCQIVVKQIKNTDIDVGLNHSGVIGIIDPTCHSYPGFVLTDDVGRIPWNGKCRCGRIGQILKFERRLKGSELGCCAVSIDKYISKKDISG